MRQEPSRMPIRVPYRLEAAMTRRPSGLRWSIQRMLAPLEELVLKPQTRLVRLHGANRLDDGVDPRLRFELAELARCDGALASVVIRVFRVPPDAGVQSIRQLHARLIGTRLRRRPVEVHQVWPRDHAQRCL